MKDNRELLDQYDYYTMKDYYKDRVSQLSRELERTRTSLRNAQDMIERVRTAIK
jgi:hypothetical protein